MEVTEPLLKTIREDFGPQVADRLEPTLRLMQDYRAGLVQLQACINDPNSLERVATQSKLYLSMWTSICQDFTFGTDKGCIDVKFVWTDSYGKKKKKTPSTNPNSERLAVLYNLGVVYNQMGINLSNPNGSYKDAVGKFMTAAWIFEQIRTELGNYKGKDLEVDLTDQNAHMCAHLMKAQAQQCVYEFLRVSAPDKYGLMAKVAMQAAICYGSAFSYASTHPISDVADKKNFIGVLEFNEYFFTAQANYMACLDYQDKCEKESVGIGKAIAYVRKAMQFMEKYKKNEKSLTPSAVTKSKSLLDEYRAKEEYLNKKNDKIYHERIPENPDEIDPLMYTKVKSIENELVQPFDGQAILARMVPMAVQELLEEYKNKVEAVIKQVHGVVNNTNAFQSKFLAKYNLPSALYGAVRAQELPEDLWQKVKQCKEANNTSGLAETSGYVSTLAVNNCATLDTLMAKLAQEEQEDKALRDRYGAAWTIEPSEKINRSLKKGLKYYKDKLTLGKVADDKARTVMNDCRERLALLDLDKAELIAKMPQTKSDGKEMSPSAVK